MIVYILITLAFIFEALMDASNFHKESKIWKYIPIKDLNKPGDDIFKFDVFHLSKYFYISCIFLSGYFLSEEISWYTILIFIGLRLVFFDRLLYIIKYWK